MKTEQKNINYSLGLKKSKLSFKEKLQNLFLRFKKVDENYYSSLEEILIGADVGASLSMDIIDKVKREAKLKNINDPKTINTLVVNILKDAYMSASTDFKLNISNNGPTVILVMGVNGVGKTTSIAKLAYKLSQDKKKVLLIAADTFRAGAVEQLEEWSNRINVGLYKGELNQDPSSVIYKGLENAIKEKYDFVIIDTAGRLQTKDNLMNEADKMVRVIKKLLPDAPNEYLLVIDATTGQNGVYQAKAFNEISSLTGIILTKMDGTSKGGIVLAIKDQLNIPVKYIGLGEKVTDLEEFDIELFLNGLLEE